MASKNAPVALTEPVAGRVCGTCTLCCKVMVITALNKPYGKWCDHCEPGVGCKIYSDRPDECRTFMCMWLVDARLGPEWKPNKSKIVITNARDGNGLEIRCDPGFPQAWRREPYYSQILELAHAARPHDGTIVVCVLNRMTLVAPEGEFPLGDVMDDDRIIREFSSDRLVSVRLSKAPATKH
jgi:hypothetical protein